MNPGTRTRCTPSRHQRETVSAISMKRVSAIGEMRRPTPPPRMRLLHYKGLDLRRVKGAFDKIKAAIEADDFRSADVK